MRWRVGFTPAAAAAADVASSSRQARVWAGEQLLLQTLWRGVAWTRERRFRTFHR